MTADRPPTSSLSSPARGQLELSSSRSAVKQSGVSKIKDVPSKTSQPCWSPHSHCVLCGPRHSLQPRELPAPLEGWFRCFPVRPGHRLTRGENTVGQVMGELCRSPFVESIGPHNTRSKPRWQPGTLVNNVSILAHSPSQITTPTQDVNNGGNSTDGVDARGGGGWEGGTEQQLQLLNCSVSLKPLKKTANRMSVLSLRIHYHFGILKCKWFV